MSLSNRSKIWLLILLFLILALIVTLVMPPKQGMNNRVNVQDEVLRNPAFSPVKGPVALKPYVVVDDLTNYDENGEVNDNTYICGLKDKTMEDKLNKIIADKVQKMAEKGLPPYRGIKAVFKSESQINYDYGPIVSLGAVNNILNVSISRFGSYDDYKEEIFYSFEDKEIYQYDLNTGEEIHLADLFSEDVDYVTLLSGFVSDQILDNHIEDNEDYVYEGLQTVTPFQGIDPNQKFFLSGYGLDLIFDYNTPEFDTNFYPQSITIPYSKLGDHFIGLNRFYDESKTSIYDDTRELELILVPPCQTVFEYDPSYVAEDMDAHISVRVGKLESYSSPEVEKIVDSYLSVPTDFLDERMEMAKKWIADHPNTFIDLSYDAVVSAYPKILTIEINQFYDGYPTIDDRFRASRTYLLDSETGKEMELKDLFTEGYDYQAAVKDSFHSEYDEYDMDIDYENMFSELSFTVDSYGIAFTLPGENYTASSSFLSQYDFPEEQPDLYAYLPYEEIGYENILMFQD